MREIRCGVIVYFVVLEEFVGLHGRGESQEPAKLRCRENSGTICLYCQAFESGAREIRPLAPKPWAMSSGSSTVIGTLT